MLINYWSVLKTAKTDAARTISRPQNSSLMRSQDQDGSLKEYVRLW